MPHLLGHSPDTMKQRPRGGIICVFATYQGTPEPWLEGNSDDLRLLASYCGARKSLFPPQHPSLRIHRACGRLKLGLSRDNGLGIMFFFLRLSIPESRVTVIVHSCSYLVPERVLPYDTICVDIRWHQGLES